MAVKSYGFDLMFERALVTLCCSRPRFYGRVGNQLDYEALSSEPAQLAMRTAQSIAKDLGHGPDKPLIVIQRLRRWMGQGQVTLEQIEAVNDMFDEAEDAGLPSEEAVIGEVAPVLQRRYQQAAVETAMDEYAKRGDFARVMDIIAKAQNVGQTDKSEGVSISAKSMAAIDQLRNVERLSTGVMELDMIIDGGLWRGAEGVVVGGAGSGKSFFLSHQASEGMLAKRHVLLATLELPEPLVMARVMSNLTAVPIQNILSGDSALAASRLEAMSPSLGPCVIKYFTPHATTVEDLKEWIRQCEDREGRAVDLLVVDYADKLSAKVADKESGDYKTMRVVYESLRHMAVEKDFWVWTASQTRRSAEKGKRKADVEDVADSLHKSRVADMMISLNARGEENETILFHVAKNRLGASHRSVGPLPHDFACGRMVPLNR
jgi:KaiC/GvpD/RAD55 family RecA-like ATPase